MDLHGQIRLLFRRSARLNPDPTHLRSKLHLAIPLPIIPLPMIRLPSFRAKKFMREDAGKGGKTREKPIQRREKPAIIR